MLRTITPAEMKRIETRAMAEGKATGEGLMARAAAHVAAAAKAWLPGTAGRVLAVCGAGNNGGDGMAALRLLRGDCPALPLTLWLMEGALSPDAHRELTRLQADCPGVDILRVSSEPFGGDPPALPGDTACIIDALFGTGLSREVTGAAAELCGLMNEAGARDLPVIAVDIPSGLSGETGQVMGVAVRARETVTFHRPKPGLYLGMGPDFAGRITVGDIGLLPDWDDAEGFSVLEPADLSRLLPPRRPVTHKGSYGRALVIAGSRGMAGAAALCALAALRTGAGLVTIACPETITDTLQQLCPCAMCLPLPEDGERAWKALKPALSQADAVALGCGLGEGTVPRALALKTMALLAKENVPAVLDADALNALAGAAGRDFSFTPRQILTPHPAEAARLLGCSTAEVTEDAPKAARRLAERFGASVVLKGAVSVLVSGGLNGLNVLGTPALAKGGSGDVLAGVLAALAANGSGGALTLSPFDILQAGCALHGLAGKAAAAIHGERGVLAADVCDFLGRNLS